LCIADRNEYGYQIYSECPSEKILDSTRSRHSGLTCQMTAAAALRITTPTAVNTGVICYINPNTSACVSQHSEHTTHAIERRTWFTCVSHSSHAEAGLINHSFCTDDHRPSTDCFHSFGIGMRASDWDGVLGAID